MLLELDPGPEVRQSMVSFWSLIIFQFLPNEAFSDTWQQVEMKTIQIASLLRNILIWNNSN